MSRRLSDSLVSLATIRSVINQLQAEQPEQTPDSFAKLRYAKLAARLITQLNRLVAALDQLFNQQLSLILQHPDFKALESRWRSLAQLLSPRITRQRVRIRLFDLGWQALADDLSMSFDLTTTVLYRKIYQQELDTLGGEPFGVLLVDHPLASSLDEWSGYDELHIAGLLAELGERCLCPVIMGVASDFFGSNECTLITDQERMQRILASDDFASWQALRKNPASRFLGLVLPQVLIRAGWQHYRQGFTFNEEPVYNEQSDLLWGNAAYSLAAVILQEFNRVGWFGALRLALEEQTAALLPAPDCKGHRVEPIARVKLTEQHETTLAQAGFIPLSTTWLTGKLAIYSNSSVYQAPSNRSDDQLAAQLQTVLMLCRFGHYLKQLLRVRIGSFQSAARCELELNEWLQSYISNVEYANDELLARYPLKQGRVTVSGDKLLSRYHCEVALQPHFQYDRLQGCLSLGRIEQASQQLGHSP